MPKDWTLCHPGHVTDLGGNLAHDQDNDPSSSKDKAAALRLSVHLPLPPRAIKHLACGRAAGNATPHWHRCLQGQRGDL